MISIDPFSISFTRFSQHFFLRQQLILQIGRGFTSMSRFFGVMLTLVVLGLIPTARAFSQTALPSTASASSEVSGLASELLRARTETDEGQLLSSKPELVNSQLLVALKALASPYIQKGEYGEAARICQIAIRVAEKMGDRKALGIALCDLGSVYGRQQNKSADALTYLQKSLSILEEVGDKRGQARVLQAIGVAYNLERKHDLSLEYYNKSLALSEQEGGDRNLTALTLNSLGLTHSSMGHYEIGLQFYEKSRVLSEQLNDKSILNMALNNIGTYYIAQARYSEALEYLQRSLKVIEEMGSDGDRRSLAYKLQNIGLIYRHQGRHDQALSYAQRSLKILEDIDDKFGIANLQNNIGVIYKSQGLYDRALESFQKSNAGYQSLKATPGIARTLNNIGDVYRLQGRYDEALNTLQKGFQLRESNGDRAGMALSLNNLGRLYEDKKQYADMLDVSSRAARLAGEINGREEAWDAQDRMGRAYTALNQPDEALKSFAKAINTVESLRREVAGGEQQQQSFLENKLSPWLGAIDVLVSQGKNNDAFTLAEQSKARVLLDTMQAGRSSLQQSLSANEREAEEEQRLRVVSLNTQLTNELRRDKPNAPLVAKLKSEVTAARLEFEDFETRLYASHPELRVRRGEAPIVKADELNAFLADSSSALLEYVVAQNQTYLFVVTKGLQNQADLRVYELPVKQEELTKKTEEFRQQLAGRDLGFRPNATRLYELLLKPAQAQIGDKKKLIIAPDNILWDLPFQALVNTNDHFVIQDAAVSYAPSLTVLREVMNRPDSSAGTTPAKLLALGNPSLGTQTISKTTLNLRDEKLEPLPAAEQEVKALGHLYGSARSKVYVGSEAREDRVKSEAANAQILHFATHGVVNNASPMYSHLVLAEAGSNEDGLLEAWELMRMKLHANLAVLSACETARGRIGAGEGVIGLSWAMFIAGVPSIVVSQWKVESSGTRDLMVNFHRSLIASSTLSARLAKARAESTGIRSRDVDRNATNVSSSPYRNAGSFSKAEALREATLKLMKNPETSHPFYWASFILVGDAR